MEINDINQNIEAIIAFVGFYMAIRLLLKKEKRYFYLSLWFLVYAFEYFCYAFKNTIPSFFHSLNDNFGPLLALFFPIMMLFFVLDSSLIPKKNKIKHNVKIFFGLFCFCYLIDPILAYYDISNDQIFKIILRVATALYCWFLIIKIIQIINKNNKIINEIYSDEFTKFQWIKNYLYAVLFYLVIGITVFYPVELNLGVDLGIVSSIIDLVLIIWPFTIILNFERPIPLIENYQEPKRSKSRIAKDIDEVTNYKKRITEALLKDEFYAKESITIMDLANRIEIHPKKLSETINSNFNCNFNHLINSFRITRAKEILKEDLYPNYSIEGIANKLGYKSKRGFYKVFKTQTGLTPGQYKKRHKYSKK